MNLTVFGATGMVGKQVVKLGMAHGHNILAFGRNIESLIDQDSVNENLQVMKGYIFDQDDVYTAIKNADAVISVLGGGIDGNDKTRSLGIKNILAQMKKAGVSRVIALGGMGVLNADDETLLIDKPGYPEEYKPVGREHLRAWEYLKESNTDWTFICAPDILDEPAKGQYYTNKDFLPEPNNYHITNRDLAAFIIEELSSNNFIKSRVGISN